MNPLVSDCSQITFLSVHAVVQHKCDHLCIAKQKQEGSSVQLLGYMLEKMLGAFMILT